MTIGKPMNFKPIVVVNERLGLFKKMQDNNRCLIGLFELESGKVLGQTQEMVQSSQLHLEFVPKYAVSLGDEANQSGQ